MACTAVIMVAVALVTKASLSSSPDILVQVLTYYWLLLVVTFSNTHYLG
jgi:hypothetical protein